jgi:hypothetical protein
MAKGATYTCLGILCLLSTLCVHAAAIELFFAPSGEAAGDNFGFAVSAAGDVNGDGFDDMIVGAMWNDAGGPDAGRAYVYFGNPAGEAVGQLTLTGKADDEFGRSVGFAGDVNADGYADVIVGAPGRYLDGVGRACVYYGGPELDASADLELTGDGASNPGYSVGTAGDLNGDGFDDMIIGALGIDGGAGRAYVYYGGPAIDAVIDLALIGEPGEILFGLSVSTVADLNGDGFDDVIVSGRGEGPGRAYVYYGGPAVDAVPDLILAGEATDYSFGHSVSSASDINGDGFEDVIVGAPEDATTGTLSGAAYVYYGGVSVDVVADLVLVGEATSDRFGVSVKAAGDVDLDGFADVIVGADGSDSGRNDTGRAYVYCGGPWVDATADLILTGEAAYDYFGVSVSTAGDINGDGSAEMIVGALKNDTGGEDAGRAYVYSVRPRPTGLSHQRIVGGASNRLHQNSPNPFNEKTTIRYRIDREAHVRLTILDPQGRLVRRLVLGIRTPATHSAEWDGRDESGRRVASGVYLFQLDADQIRESRKLIVLR